MIKLPLSPGDIVLGGKFRNKPIEIASFEKDELNQPIIVTKKGKKIKLLAVRIKSVMPGQSNNAKNIKKENKKMEAKKLTLMEAMNLSSVSMEDGGSYDIGIDDGCIVIKPSGGAGNPVWLSDEALSLLVALKNVIGEKYGSIKNFEMQQALSDDELGEDENTDRVVNMVTANVL